MVLIQQKQKIRRGGKNTQKNYTKKDFNDPDNHDGVITHLEPDILECEVKSALGSITMNNASRGDGIPAQLFQIPKDVDVNVLHSICQPVWNQISHFGNTIKDRNGMDLTEAEDIKKRW